MTDISVATFSLTEGDNGSQVSIIFSDGTSENISDQHQNFESIVSALINKPEGYAAVVYDLANIPKTIGRKFRTLSDRVTTDGSEVYFDGDPIDGSLAQYILKLLREDAQKAASFFDGGGTAAEETTEGGATWEALIKFLESLYANPNEQSRNSLYEFITRYGLTIRKDGSFIAYKGLNEEFGSHNRGYGIVDDVEVNGVLMNLPGSVLRFPRRDVDSNTSVGCSQGLHAGTHAYATQWARGGKLVAVAIKPINVVSVPDDCTFQKLRVCEYEVLNEVDPLEEALATSGWDSASYWDDDEEECDECDGYCEGDCDEYSDCDDECCDGESDIDAGENEDNGGWSVDSNEETDAADDSYESEVLANIRRLLGAGADSLNVGELLANAQSSISTEAREIAQEFLENSPLGGILDAFGGFFGDEDSKNEASEVSEDSSKGVARDLAEGDVVDFDYVSANGSSQHVQEAEVEDVEVDYFRAYVPSKGGYRTFKFDGVSNMVDSDAAEDKQEESKLVYSTSTPTLSLAEQAANLKSGQKIDVSFTEKGRSRSFAGVQVLIANDKAVTVKLLSGGYLAFEPSDVTSLSVTA